MAMYTDFSSLLATATIISGLIWGVDVCVFKRLRQNKAAKEGMAEIKEPKLVEYARSFFPILLVVCVLRSFIAEPFRIPSGSMKPTLLEGDFILVNKYLYGIRLPLVGTKVLNVDSPKRGDILVFRSPQDTSIDFIKRVVGVPGDKIAYKDKTLYLNGKPVLQESLGTVNELTRFGHIPIKHLKEMLDKPHSIYLYPVPGEEMQEVTVPKGEYFVMGDNRDDSQDSRSWGFVPEQFILGKAFFIWMSWDHNAKDIRWNRIGHGIDS